MKRPPQLLMCATVAAATAMVMVAVGSQPASAAVIGATVADASTGDYNLTSVTVQRRDAVGGPTFTLTYTPERLTGMGLTDIDAFQVPLLVPAGAPLPAAGTRATLVEDLRLDTGVINITTTNGTPDRAFEATFATPILNSVGEDILLFEIGGNDGIRFWINDDRTGQGATLTTGSYSADLLSGMPFTLYSYNNGGDQDINSLAELESSTGFAFNANSTGSVRAIGLDLSDVGVAPGEAVSRIRFQSVAGGGGRLDPVLVVGLPAVPEPAHLALLAAPALALLSRRRRPQA